jgi:methylenetetrahydrofolate reductase (NADPH)
MTIRDLRLGSTSEMKIIDKLSASRPAFSFEYFPPKDEAGLCTLYDTIDRLKRYEPTFVSVTYGAGGSTRRLTTELVLRIKCETSLETMAHLTCVGARRRDLLQMLDEYRAGGIQNVLALRGDLPTGSDPAAALADGCAYASELVQLIRSKYDFCVAAACYPEKHPEAPDFETDLRNLKLKVDAGVDLLITQLFFDNRDYFRFVEQARAAGITVPVLAGIMPVTGVAQAQRFTAMCGARIPATLLAQLEAASHDREQVREVGVAHAVAQCRELLAAGVPGIHFYTLNRSPATVRVLEAVR